MSYERTKLEAQWEQEFGDHEECDVCGSQCRDAFMGDDLTPAQKSAPELLKALRAIAAKTCGCMSSRDENWHSDECWKGVALKAIKSAEGE